MLFCLWRGVLCSGDHRANRHWPATFIGQQQSSIPDSVSQSSIATRRVSGVVAAGVRPPPPTPLPPRLSLHSVRGGTQNIDCRGLLLCRRPIRASAGQTIFGFCRTRACHALHGMTNQLHAAGDTAVTLCVEGIGLRLPHIFIVDTFITVLAVYYHFLRGDHTGQQAQGTGEYRYFSQTVHGRSPLPSLSGRQSPLVSTIVNPG